MARLAGRNRFEKCQGEKSSGVQIVESVKFVKRLFDNTYTGSHVDNQPSFIHRHLTHGR